MVREVIVSTLAYEIPESEDRSRGLVYIITIMSKRVLLYKLFRENIVA